MTDQPSRTRPAGSLADDGHVASSNQHLNLILPRKRHSWMNHADTNPSTTKEPGNPDVASCKRPKGAGAGYRLASSARNRVQSSSRGQPHVKRSADKAKKINESDASVLPSPALSSSPGSAERLVVDNQVSLDTAVQSRPSSITVPTSASASEVPDLSNGVPHARLALVNTPPGTISSPVAPRLRRSLPSVIYNTTDQVAHARADEPADARDELPLTQGPGRLPDPSRPAAHQLRKPMDAWLQMARDRRSSYLSTIHAVVEKPRYKMLEDACSDGDTFYVLLHQVFCLWTIKPDNARLLVPADFEDTDAGFGTLSSSLRPNTEISLSHLDWFARFPLNFSDEATLIAYSQHFQAIAKFLTFLKRRWPYLLENVRQRQFPLTGRDIVTHLQCPSSTLAHVFFLVSQRILQVVSEPHVTMMRRLFNADLVQESRMLQDCTEPHVAEPGRSSVIQQYLQIMREAGIISARVASSNPQAVNSASASGNWQISVHPQPTEESPTAAGNPATASSSLTLGPNSQANGAASSASHTRAEHQQQTQARPHPGQGSQGSQRQALPPARHKLPSQAHQMASIPSTQARHRTLAPPQPHEVRMPLYPTSSFQEEQQFRASHTSSQQVMHSGWQARIQHHSSVPNHPQQGMQHSNHHNPGVNPATAYSRELAPPELASPRATPLQPNDHALSPWHWTSIRNGLHLIRVRSPQREAACLATEMYCSFVEDVVTEITVLHAQWGLKDFVFDISTEDHSKRSRTFERDGLQVCPYVDGSTRYRFRSCLFPAGAELPTKSQWTLLPCSWAPNTAISCNGKPTTLRRRTHFKYDLALELTDMVVEGRNKIRVSLPDVKRNQVKDRVYIGAVERLRVLTVSSIQRLVLESPHAAAKDTRFIIRHRLKQSDSEDIIVQNATISVSVVDPFSAILVSTPVRGKQCRHLECFDRDNWINTRPKKPGVGPGEPSMVDVWKCPICGGDARPVSLVVDDYFIDVVESLRKEQKNEVKKIIVDAEANWTPIQKAETASEHNPAQMQTRIASASAPPPETVEIEDD